MSATPEQIAERLEALCGRFDGTNGDEPASVLWSEFANAAMISRIAAATLRAQAERVRVLEEGLRRIESWEVAGNLTDNEPGILLVDMPSYVAGRAHAEIAMIKNCASKAIRRGAALKAAP